MSLVLAIDPGVRGCGVSILENRVLLSAAYVRNPIRVGGDAQAVASMAWAAWDWARVRTGAREALFAVEVPRVYPAANQKGDQNDLIAEAGVAFAFAGIHATYGAPVITYYPRDWKGTVDADDVMIPRIKNRLTPSEMKVLTPCAKSLEHNVWDAIGIGLKAVGRLEPKRVIVRTR